MPEIKHKSVKNALKAKIDTLPPALLDEVEDFVDFVLVKHAPSAKTEKEEMKLNWQGALSDLKDQYTSVELKHKALEWWEEASRDY